MRQSFANLDGINIRYLDADKNIDTENNQHHVLFIHGLGSSADRWLDIPDAISLAGLHGLAIDLPGFGLSDKPEKMEYTIPGFVRFVADFIRQYEKPRELPNGKMSIVGHSLGGYIAVQLAIDHPDLVEKLVLIDTSGMLGAPTPLLQEYLAAAMNPSRQSVRKVFEQMVADPIRIPDVLVDGFIYRLGQQGAKHAFKSAFDNSVNTRLEAEKLHHISNIQTLIIWGVHDRLIPLDHYKIFQKAIQGSRVEIIEDAGHAPFAEKPAIVYEILRNFLLSNYKE